MRRSYFLARLDKPSRLSGDADAQHPDRAEYRQRNIRKCALDCAMLPTRHTS
jgi:hypothetical protein